MQPSFKSASTAQYPDTHWCWGNTWEKMKKQPFFVAGFAVPAHKQMVSVYVNPTDQTCYRLLVSILNDGSGSDYNRLATSAESLSVSQVVCFVSQALAESCGLFVQSLHLGNNSHSMPEGTLDYTLGTAHEPYFYHVHLLCRGDPKHPYLANVPLGGPPVGKIFPLQVSTTEFSKTQLSDLKPLAQAIQQVLVAHKDKAVKEYGLEFLID